MSSYMGGSDAINVILHEGWDAVNVIVREGLGCK